MDNKVFKLAQKIKDDMQELVQDYHIKQHDVDYINTCLANSQVIIEDMEKIWDVNLKDYYVISLLL